MIAAALCLVFLIAGYSLGRRDLVHGIGVTLVAGYSYGILRANLITPASHFLWDAAVFGLFAAQLFRRLPIAERRRLSAVRAWLLLLVLWPAILFVVPVQDPLVQLVGFRANVYVLGFLLLGARLSTEQWYRLALWVAVLDLLTFALALVEFRVGIEPFFPESAVTEIMYRSRVLLEGGSGTPLYRIPSSFSSAHAYGGTMVATFPLVLGAWIAASRSELHAVSRPWHRSLFLAAVIAAALGVFMSAARQHAVILFVLLLAASAFGRLKTSHRLGWIAALLVMAGVVSQTERLQRFTELEDEELVRGRVSISVNASFVDLAKRYPMGNGLGGGGTSVPYFLMDRVRPVTVLENEYSRIMLEQGVPGLIMWVTFVLWIFSKGMRLRGGPWEYARRLSWVLVSVFFLSATIGLGLLASIPQSSIFLLLAGWVAAPQARPAGWRRPRGAAVASRLPPIPLGAPGGLPR